MNIENLWAAVSTIAFLLCYGYNIYLKELMKGISPLLRHLLLLTDGEDVLKFVQICKNCNFDLKIIKKRIYPLIVDKGFFNKPNDIAQLYFFLYQEKIPGSKIKPIGYNNINIIKIKK